MQKIVTMIFQKSPNLVTWIRTNQYLYIFCKRSIRGRGWGRGEREQRSRGRWEAENCFPDCEARCLKFWPLITCEAFGLSFTYKWDFNHRQLVSLRSLSPDTQHHPAILISIMVDHLNCKQSCIVEKNVPIVFVLPSIWQDGAAKLFMFQLCFFVG